MNTFYKITYHLSNGFTYFKNPDQGTLDNNMIKTKTQISENEYDLQKLYRIITPDTNPETGNAWTNDQEKQNWISKQLENQDALKFAKDGLLNIILNAFLDTLRSYGRIAEHEGYTDIHHTQFEYETAISVVQTELLDKLFNNGVEVSQNYLGRVVELEKSMKNNWPATYVKQLDLIKKYVVIEHDTAIESLLTKFEVRR